MFFVSTETYLAVKQSLNEGKKTKRDEVPVTKSKSTKMADNATLSQLMEKYEEEEKAYWNDRKKKK